MVITNLGELIAFKITRGNVHDGSAASSLLSTLEGLAFGDKGYIGKKLFDELLKKTSVRSYSALNNNHWQLLKAE